MVRRPSFVFNRTDRASRPQVDARSPAHLPRRALARELWVSAWVERRSRRCLKPGLDPLEPLGRQGWDDWVLAVVDGTAIGTFVVGAVEHRLQR